MSIAAVSDKSKFPIASAKIYAGTATRRLTTQPDSLGISDNTFGMPTVKVKTNNLQNCRTGTLRTTNVR